MDYQQPPNQPYGNQPFPNQPPQNQPIQNQPQPNIPKKTSLLAILSLIFSILGLIILGFGVVGIVLAILAKKQISKNPNIGGGGLAKAGLIIGIIGVVLFILILAFGLALTGIRNSFIRTTSTLEDISSDIEKELTLSCCEDCVDKASELEITDNTILCTDLDISETCISFFTDIIPYSINECSTFIAENS